MPYAFESLRIWQHALEYDDLACAFAAALPSSERFGLTDQLRRASASIGLNIAEGTTSLSDREKNRFIGYSVRSFLETVAAQRLALRRGYRVDAELVTRIDLFGETFYKELQAFRKAVRRRIDKRGGSRYGR